MGVGRIRTFPSSSDSDSLIFSRSYHSVLLITTPTLTPSLVKTSLWEGVTRKNTDIGLKSVWLDSHISTSFPGSLSSSTKRPWERCCHTYLFHVND